MRFCKFDQYRQIQEGIEERREVESKEERTIDSRKKVILMDWTFTKDLVVASEGCGFDVCGDLQRPTGSLVITLS